MAAPALLFVNLAVVLVCMSALWAVATRTGDPSFVDAFWPFGFVIVAAVSFAFTADGDGARRAALLVLTAVWGLRLAGYLFARWRRSGPDPRYVALLRNAPNRNVAMLTKVFLLQGALMWVVSLPLQLGMAASATGFTLLGYAGIALSVTGIAFESIGDAQLARFKADPAHAGKVMDRGLWRYTRHPNYFGDACHWWGVFLVALVDVTTALSVIGPLLMNFLLVRWSGKALLERKLGRSKPGYADYVARTSGFFPRPPRRG